MSPELLSRRTIAFVNIAHALDHFVLLIYPTAVIAIAAERQLSYASLIGLSTGAFVAFGLFSLPMGWIADRVGRRNLLGIFFGGCGIACLGLSTANSSVMFGIWLIVLGLFSAIYHPIGSTALVTHTSHLGRDQRRVGQSRRSLRLRDHRSFGRKPWLARCFHSSRTYLPLSWDRLHDPCAR
jgi:MFS family permease